MKLKWVSADPVATTFAPRHDEALVGLAVDVDVDVADLVDALVAIDRRVDDRVVEEQAALLGLLVPALRVLLVRLVEVRVRAERAEERGLVVGAAAHPAVADARPLGDRVAVGDDVLDRAGRAEERVGEGAAAGVGRRREDVAARRVVERVVHARDHPGRVAERRVRGDVVHALAVRPDLAAVADRLEVLGPRHRLDGRGRRGLRRHSHVLSPLAGGPPWPATAPNLRLRPTRSNTDCGSIE